MKIIYTTEKGEHVYEEPGNRKPGDKRFYIGFNGTKWAHTMELIGAALRAKAWVEDNNYPHGKGAVLLFEFMRDCILTITPITQLTKQYKMVSAMKRNKMKLDEFNELELEAKAIESKSQLDLFDNAG
jgi:hypothetical protein